MSAMNPTIGLEVHIQLKTATKMFCGCSLAPDGAAPNTHICPICMGYPGTMPVPNARAIALTIALGKLLGGTIPTVTKFDRKHYFYPDLPKGYQISQYDQPLVVGGAVPTLVEHSVKTFALERIHLEEDAGKLIHTNAGSVVDYNRAGTPLLELVTKPVFHSPQEAGAFLRNLQLIVRRLGLSDGDMEKGHLRCDANVSVSPDATLGAPVEVKNLNSFRFVERALAYEIERQTKLLKQGEKITRQTRGWDEKTSSTKAQRGKEEAPDYRYFPEPDIPAFDPSIIATEAKLKQVIFPSEQFIQLQENFPALKSADLAILVGRSATDDWVGTFREAAAIAPPSSVISWMVHRGAEPSLGGKLIGNFVGWVHKNGLPNTTADQALKDLQSGATFEDVQKRYTVASISDDELTNEIRAVLTKNPQALGDVRAGKAQAQGFLVGQVMQALQGKVDPRRAAAILATLLKGG